jgi:hypothetical protein
MENVAIDLNKILQDFVEQGKDDITKLSYEDKAYLTALIIISKGKSLTSTFVTDTPKTSEYAPLLAHYVINRSIEGLMTLVGAMMDGAIDRCSDIIIELLKETVEMKKEL